MCCAAFFAFLYKDFEEKEEVFAKNESVFLILFCKKTIIYCAFFVSVLLHLKNLF